MNFSIFVLFYVMQRKCHIILSLGRKKKRITNKRLERLQDHRIVHMLMVEEGTPSPNKCCHPLSHFISYLKTNNNLLLLHPIILNVQLFIAYEQSRMNVKFSQYFLTPSSLMLYVIFPKYEDERWKYQQHVVGRTGVCCQESKQCFILSLNNT